MTHSSRRLIYLSLVTAAAFMIFFQSTHPQRHWLIWSGLFLSLITQGDSFLKRQMIILLTAIGSLLSVWLVANAHVVPMALAFVLLVITLVCVYSTQRHPEYSLSYFLINLFALLGACFPPSHAEEAQCLLFLASGAFIPLVLQFIFLPGFKKRESQAFFHIAMQCLSDLNRDIFACFLERDYPDNKYQYEKRLHSQKMRLMQTVSHSKKIGLTFANELTRIFEILLDLAQLRGRVSDFSIFQVCAIELTAIQDAMDQLLSGKSKDTERLFECIQRFEETYQHVLTVTAKEPLPFLLFIASLRAFSEAIGGLERCGK
jgi:hypothetical protein